MTLDARPIADSLAQARHAAGAMKAATMTFVLFFEDASVGAWVRERTHALAEKHPSRVVIFDATRPLGEDRVEPSTARGEWIEMGVRGASEHELAAALRALALPEAPIVLAWIANGLASDPRFGALAEIATTVICSTSVIDTGTTALRELCAFMESRPAIAVQDLAYLRLAAWQDLIAGFFDDPALADELGRIRRVEIAAGSASEMYYVLGWLASRLGWTPCAADRLCNREGAEISFSLAFEGAPRRLERVALAGATTRCLAEVHAQDPNAVCLRVEGRRTHAERCAPLHSFDVASLVERAILTRGRDPIFIDALQTARHLIERQEHLE